MLIFPLVLREQVSRHAGATYPEECCGILLGKKDAGGRGVVHEVIAAGNVAAESARRTRYDIDPLAILRADNAAAARQLEILGFYHSHPDHPAVPSSTDDALAWADYFYAICSIRADGGGELRAWQLVAGEQRLAEVSLA